MRLRSYTAILLAFFTAINAAAEMSAAARYLLVTRKINSWNDDNKQRCVVDINGFAVAPGDNKFLVGVRGSLKNGTDDTVGAVVVDYVIANKTTNAEVVRVRVAIRFEVFKTAEVEFPGVFESDTYYSKTGRPSLESIYAATQQLAGKYTWRPEIVAIIPKSIIDKYDYNAFEAMNAVEIVSPPKQL